MLPFEQVEGTLARSFITLRGESERKAPTPKREAGIFLFALLERYNLITYHNYSIIVIHHQKKGLTMKYQIYLQKDISDIINTVAKHYNKKAATLIKEMLESNFRIALEQEKKLQKK